MLNEKSSQKLLIMSHLSEFFDILVGCYSSYTKRTNDVSDNKCKRKNANDKLQWTLKTLLSQGM